MRRKGKKQIVSYRAPGERATIAAELVDKSIAHLLVRVLGIIDERSISNVFAWIRPKVIAANAKRVVIDSCECRIN